MATVEQFKWRLVLAGVAALWLMAGALFLNALMLASIADIIKTWKL